MFWSSRASALPRRLLIVAAVALIPAVAAGCEAGADAPTLHWHYPTDGTGTVAGGISVRDVFVLGPAGTTPLAAGQSASLFFALVNTGTPDRLLSIAAPGTAAAVTLQGGGIALGTEDSVLLTGPSPRAVLTGLTRPLTSGSAVNLVLTFQKAGTVRIRVPVIAMGPGYSTFSPAPSPTPTHSGHKHHSAASATPTPTPSSS